WLGAVYIKQAVGPGGTGSGEYDTAEFNRVRIDGKGEHVYVLIRKGDVDYPNFKIELVGDHTNYTVFRVDNPDDYRACSMGEVDKVALRLAGNADDLIEQAAPIVGQSSSDSS